MFKNFLIIGLLAGLLCSSASADLVITGVIDGPRTGGLPKGVELYATTDIADLSLYGIGSASNGGGTDGEEFTFSGSATAGSYITVASEGTEWTNYFGSGPTFNAGAAVSINGDDAIELFFNGSVIDTFGDITYAAGTGGTLPWNYLDGYAYRVNGTGPDGATFQLGNWTYSGQNFLDSQGSSGVNGDDGKTVPFGTYQGAAIPEPTSSMVLFGLLGATGVFARRRRASKV